MATLPPQNSPATLSPNKKFRNIDEEFGFIDCQNELKNPETRNFVVDFSDVEARCATNLTPDEIRTLLGSRNPTSGETRWINFWGGDLEKSSIEIIVDHYGLAPRLISLLCSKAFSSDNQKVSNPRASTDQHVSMNSPSSTFSSSFQSQDAENSLPMNGYKTAKLAARQPMDFRKATFGEIVDDIWHFCSVDWGHGYLHVGFNSLFSIPEFKVESKHDRPAGKRIWTSLVLCSDGTMISVSEKAFPGPEMDLKILNVVRRNTLNVFRHLSKISKTEAGQNDLMAVNIRNFDAKPTDEHHSSAVEGANLLFYYLFDDWMTSYALAAGNEYPYGIELEKLRVNMFKQADIELVESLHLIGRQIAILKKMYQSLELIIKRILERQRLRPVEAADPAGVGATVNNFINFDRTQSQIPENGSPFRLQRTGRLPIGIRLTDQAMFRFERLLDRIGLFALSRIEEYLAEKETLVTMNFNLIALKDSQATERLTRVTVLLSKIAALFLPLSLMTSYFSVSIPNITATYTKKTYWLAFLVVVLLSVFFLVIFQFVSETVKGRTIYKSFTSTAWTSAKKKKHEMMEARDA